MRTFYDIEGQNRAISILQKAYLNKSIAQAYLFEGISGVGKSLVAKIFIKLINCENPVDRLNPCNNCKNCRAVDNGTFLDFLHIKPSSAKEIIKINTIRDIEEKISYKAYMGTYKAVLIEDAEQMNISAANALLKTLEEPPPFTVFILTVSRVSSLPDTILSRCQRILFNPLSYETIYSNLKKDYNLPENDLKTVALISQGSMTMAKDILKNDILSKRREFIETVFTASNLKLAFTIKYIKKMIKEFKGEKFYFLIFFLEIIKSILRDAFVIKSGLPDNSLLNPDYKNISSKIALKDDYIITNEIEKITVLQKSVLTNVNLEIALEEYFISFLKRGVV